MSTFSYPRIHIKGLTVINVGTANNDDYSSYFFVEGDYAGLPVRQADSNRVQAETYCMDDQTYIDWMQKRLLVYSPKKAVQKDDEMHKGTAININNKGNYHLIPAEWNYYGDFDFKFKDAKVIGIDYGDGLVKEDPLLGAELSMNIIGPDGRVGGNAAILIDTNPEGVTASVIISEALTVSKGGQALFSGTPTSAATRWINFQRNTVLNGPNGASGTFQHAIPLDSLKGFGEGEAFLKKIPAKDSDGNPLTGLLFKYTLYRPLQPVSTQKYQYSYQNNGFYADDRYDQYLDIMEETYAKKGINPDYCMVQGTITPWYGNEVKTNPVGRYLVPDSIFKNKVQGDLTGNTNPQKIFQLAPAIVSVDAHTKTISLDLSVALPDQFEDANFDPNLMTKNPKYNFGDLVFGFTYNGKDYTISEINYTDTEEGDNQGWIFDFPFDKLPSRVIAQLDNGDFYLVSSKWGKLLKETPYLIVSDQPSVWAQQDPVAAATTKQFMWDGEEQQVSFRAFQKGKELTQGTLTLSEYDVTPNQRVEPLAPVMSTIKIGEPIEVAVQNPGVRFFTVQMGTTDCPPALYDNLNVMTVSQLNLRILPNYENYDKYYVDPTAENPVGNDDLTWEVLFEKVLRNYYLLYPVMNEVHPLNNPKPWNDPYLASRLLAYVDSGYWLKYNYMPRTRDLSDSRRTLIQAWCRKVMNGNRDPSTKIIA